MEQIDCFERLDWNEFDSLFKNFDTIEQKETENKRKEEIEFCDLLCNELFFNQNGPEIVANISNIKPYQHKQYKKISYQKPYIHLKTYLIRHWIQPCPINFKFFQFKSDIIAFLNIKLLNDDTNILIPNGLIGSFSLKLLSPITLIKIGV